MCGAILDAGRGGSFELGPTDPFESSRRYLPGTNVLETTFTTESGIVRVLDAMTVSDHGLEPMRELARSVEGVAGRVSMRWRFAPRFDYAALTPECGWRHGVPVALVRIRRGGRGELGRRPACVEGRRGGRAIRDSRGRARPLRRRRGERRAAGPAGPARRRAEARRHGALLGIVDRRAQVRRPVARRSAAQRAGAQAVDFRAERRQRRRAHDVASRGDWRRAQLGLPLLLDPRFATSRSMRCWSSGVTTTPNVSSGGSCRRRR